MHILKSFFLTMCNALSKDFTQDLCNKSNANYLVNSARNYFIRSEIRMITTLLWNEALIPDTLLQRLLLEIFTSKLYYNITCTFHNVTLSACSLTLGGCLIDCVSARWTVNRIQMTKCQSRRWRIERSSSNAAVR